ncbi:MAG: alpha/beta fold hydrolase [Alphaproteobacteria bacterium]
MTAFRHPPLAPGWVDRPHESLGLGDLALESGESIRDFVLSYVTHGTANADRSNVILALSAIGSTHHRLDAWIGPGKALDPERFCIVAVDAIGNGLTTSPSNSRTQPGLAFPRFTIRDMVESQRRLVAHLGVRRLHSVVGASMGGMQALQWGVSHPDAMETIVAMVPMARTEPWSAAVNVASRAALMADPAWPDGVVTKGWDGWVAVMQVLAGRTPTALAEEGLKAADVAPLLAERAEAMRASGMQAVDWVYQTYAYDAHDVATTPGCDGDLARSLGRIRARTLVLGADNDLYNPTAAAQAAAHAIAGCRYVEIPSPEGHMAASFRRPADIAFIDAEMRALLG